ncbi:MAG TPA: S1/P1 nuclease [Gemmatimonadaceae bacterium]|nr:S1/P1 nuclease [Gemmatimonadaceae bacterium]
MRNRLRAPFAALVLVAAGVLVLPRLAAGWNATGHRTISEIAWQNMTPTARARAVDLLLHGPALAGLASLRPTTGPDSARDRALFMNASTWPDLIRDRNMPWYAYNHPTWHYADFYWDVENGQPHDIPGTGPDSSNAGERIIAFRDALADPAVPDTTKAVDLAWILHLVADVHQPLHASSRVTAQSPLPLGDKGGNDFVLADPRHRLHGYWDSILDETVARAPGEDSIAYASRLAAMIVQQHPLSALQPRADSLDPWGWLHESLEISEHQAYVGVTPGSAPSVAYQGAAFATAETRMALAGYRLAALLNAVLK